MTVQVRCFKNPNQGQIVFGRWLARFTLLVMVLLAFSIVGPLEVAWLWIGSQVQHSSDNLTLALGTTFFGILASVILFIILLRRVEAVWVHIRRHTGHPGQEPGILESVLVVAVGIATLAFTIWFLGFAGAGGPTFAPT